MLKIDVCRYNNLIFFDKNRIAPRLAEFAQAVVAKGGLVANIWSFIDGTVRGIARPTGVGQRGDENYYLFQQSMYNGHKRKHAMKFQSLSTPDGIISHLFGPFPGRNHDSAMLAASGLKDSVREDERFRGFLIFGDPAYGKDDVVWSPFQGQLLTEQQKMVNKSMSKVRVSVEWSYGQVIQYWSYLDFKHQMCARKMSVGLMYSVAVLLTNCITCVRGGNNNSDFFQVKPPTIEEYLSVE